MHLNQLMDGIAPLGAELNPELEISGISYDTRTLRPGDLFVALDGTETDGHRYLRQALALGAAAAVCQRGRAIPGPCIPVDDTRAALALISGRWFGHPARQMRLVGITGTNGKTSTAHLVKAMLEGVLGAKVGLIGTICNRIGGQELPAHRTTPESYELHQLLRRMADAGCGYVVMEASSHALDQRRLYGLTFDAGVFTNLTQDHLDYHGTMERYRDAKEQLFRQSRTAVLNLDDPAGRYYAGRREGPLVTYSENDPRADLTAENIRLFPDRVEFEALTDGKLSRVRLPIPGGFTIYNALAALGAGTALGLPLSDCAAALKHAQGIRGRVEVVPVDAPYTVLIDYAHTPDALENILLTARDFTGGRLICLFGCGGDRDRAKRPLMGAAAGSLADVAVITSDNPRSEDPMDIIADILPGAVGQGAQVLVEADRRAAIRLALSLAEPGDVVVLAGKGHETGQEVGGKTVHLDEREEIAAYFSGRSEENFVAL